MEQPEKLPLRPLSRILMRICKKHKGCLVLTFKAQNQDTGEVGRVNLHFMEYDIPTELLTYVRSDPRDFPD